MSTNLIYENVADPTQGMSLVSNRAQNLETVRYLFTPGQYLDPDRVFQLEHLSRFGGGEEVQTHCFRRTPGGFLPRAFLTPMETWGEPLPRELVGEGAEISSVHIAGVGVAAPPTVGGHSSLYAKPLNYVKFYPGEEVGSVLRANEGKGIVEIKALMGKLWYEDAGERKPGEPQRLNRDFFPARPIELSKLRKLIEAGAGRSELHAAVARDMLTGCDQFRRWAETFVALEHGQLRERKSHQHVYRYSPVGRELLRQLEIQPQDSVLDNMTPGGMSAEQFAEVLSRFNGQGGGMVSPEMIGRIAGEVMRQMMAAQQPAAAPTEGDDPPSPPVELESMKRPQLTEIGARHGVRVVPSMSNADAVAAIRVAQAAEKGN